MPIRAVIQSTGMAVPELVRTNFDLEKMVDTTDEWIFTRTGIRERRIASEDETCSSLGSLAAQDSLKNAGVTADSVEMIVLSTTTPDMIVPSTACFVQEMISAKNAFAFDISAACSGFSYGLAIASSFIESGAVSNALVIGSDVYTKITDWTDRRTCVLFGDGAGAVYLKAEDSDRGVLISKLWSDGSGAEHLCVPSSGTKMRVSQQTIDEKQTFLYMNGPEIYKFGIRVLVDSIIKTLKASNLQINDISLFVPHQANLRILEAACKRLDIPIERMLISMDRYGNTSSASIPIALAEANKAGTIKLGDLIMTIGFGAGLTWGANLIKW